MGRAANMIYRQHTPQDLEQIAALRWKLKTEGLPPEASPSRQIFVESYLKHLRDQNDLGQTVHWVLETPTGIEGMMTLRLVAKETSLNGENRQWGYLTNVFVNAALRGHGRGSTLLQHVITFSRANDLEFVLVWPSDRSQSLYSRAGFAGTGDPLTLELT